MLYTEHLYRFLYKETIFSVCHLERPSALQYIQLTSFETKSRLFSRFIQRKKEEELFYICMVLHEYIGNIKLLNISGIPVK